MWTSSGLMKSTVVDECLSTTTSRVLFHRRIYLLLISDTTQWEIYTKYAMHTNNLLVMYCYCAVTLLVIKNNGISQCLTWLKHKKRSKLNVRSSISYFTMYNSVYECPSYEHCCILLIKSNGFQCTLLSLHFDYIKSIHIMPKFYNIYFCT